MEGGRQPITFENPLYATAPGVSGDPAVIHATQVLINDWMNAFLMFMSYHLNVKGSSYIELHDTHEHYIVMGMFSGSRYQFYSSTVSDRNNIYGCNIEVTLQNTFLLKKENDTHTLLSHSKFFFYSTWAQQLL